MSQTNSLIASFSHCSGPNASPVFQFLASQSGREPTWNFWKYLVDRQGQVIDAWGPQTRVYDLYNLIQRHLNEGKEEDGGDENESNGDGGDGGGGDNGNDDPVGNNGGNNGENVGGNVGGRGDEGALGGQKEEL